MLRSSLALSICIELDGLLQVGDLSVAVSNATSKRCACVQDQ